MSSRFFMLNLVFLEVNDCFFANIVFFFQKSIQNHGFCAFLLLFFLVHGHFFPIAVHNMGCFSRFLRASWRETIR